jgi:hypothetical protein
MDPPDIAIQACTTLMSISTYELRVYLANETL